jgi:hypothetical protein
MNEKIKELAEQATEVSEWLSGNCSPDAPDLEKFAELIIRDCYSVIIKSQRGHFNPATSWDAIKEHFGVKE